MLAELSTTSITKAKDPQSFEENQQCAAEDEYPEEAGNGGEGGHSGIHIRKIIRLFGFSDFFIFFFIFALFVKKTFSAQWGNYASPVFASNSWRATKATFPPSAASLH